MVDWLDSCTESPLHTCTNAPWTYLVELEYLALPVNGCLWLSLQTHEHQNVPCQSVI